MSNYDAGLNLKLLEAIPADAKRVLELGCANGRFGALVKQRLVTYEEAVKHSTSPSDFALLFRGVSASAGSWRGGDGGGITQSSPEPKPGASNDEFEIESFDK